MKSNAQLARVATNLGIGVAGLTLVRLLVHGLPMFQDAGWIVKGKLTVLAGTTILVDALLLSILVGFAVELRAYLVARFAEISALGTMAASLVFLLIAAIAYTDFKPLTRAWPSIKEVFIWSFVAMATLLLVQITVLLFQNRDRLAALILRQPIPAARSNKPAKLDGARAVFVGD